MDGFVGSESPEGDWELVRFLNVLILRYCHCLVSSVLVEVTGPIPRRISHVHNRC